MLVYRWSTLSPLFQGAHGLCFSVQVLDIITSIFIQCRPWAGLLVWYFQSSWSNFSSPHLLKGTTLHYGALEFSALDYLLQIHRYPKCWEIYPESFITNRIRYPSGLKKEILKRFWSHCYLGYPFNPEACKTYQWKGEEIRCVLFKSPSLFDYKYPITRHSGACTLYA